MHGYIIHKQHIHATAHIKMISLLLSFRELINILITGFSFITRMDRESLTKHCGCRRHPHYDVCAQCDECNTPVCLKCMTSQTHRGHQFTNLNDRMQDAKNAIRKHVYHIDHVMLPEVRREKENTATKLHQDEEEKYNTVCIYVWYTFS